MRRRIGISSTEIRKIRKLRKIRKIKEIKKFRKIRKIRKLRIKMSIILLNRRSHPLEVRRPRVTVSKLKETTLNSNK